MLRTVTAIPARILDHPVWNEIRFRGLPGYGFCKRFLRPGDAVIASEAYALFFSEMVWPGGSILAFDQNPERLHRLAERRCLSEMTITDRPNFSGDFILGAMKSVDPVSITNAPVWLLETPPNAHGFRQWRIGRGWLAVAENALDLLEMRLRER